jgi:hypothetical protein
VWAYALLGISSCEFYLGQKKYKNSILLKDVGLVASSYPFA